MKKFLSLLNAYQMNWRYEMEEIKKFLRLMSKEALIELCASMLFQNLVDMVDLNKALSRLEGKKEG